MISEEILKRREYERSWVNKKTPEQFAAYRKRKNANEARRRKGKKWAVWYENRKLTNRIKNTKLIDPPTIERLKEDIERKREYSRYHSKKYRLKRGPEVLTKEQKELRSLRSRNRRQDIKTRPLVLAADKRRNDKSKSYRRKWLQKWRKDPANEISYKERRAELSARKKYGEMFEAYIAYQLLKNEIIENKELHVTADQKKSERRRQNEKSKKANRRKFEKRIVGYAARREREKDTASSG